MKKFVVAVGLTLAMGASQAEANLITNGSFEGGFGNARCGLAECCQQALSGRLAERDRLERSHHLVLRPRP